MNIDGKNQILGRVASLVAKKALLGESVNLVNCSHIIISGDKKNTIDKIHNLRSIGNQYNGPFIPRVPDRYVRRVIKRMLPHKKARGREAYKRIMCYNNVPEGMDNIKSISKDASSLKTLKKITVKDLCKTLGGKE